MRGSFTEFNAQIVTTDDPAQPTVTADIDVASLDTGIKMRDDHLRSAGFFQVEKNAKMRFVSTGLRPDGEHWVLTGDLTILETTRPVDIRLELLGIDPTGLQGETRIGFDGRTTIKRSDFGLGLSLAVNGSKVIVGDKVDVTPDIEAVLDA